MAKDNSTGANRSTPKTTKAEGTHSIHAAAISNGNAAQTKLKFQTAAELASKATAEVPWVARPWVALSSITEVVGKPKAAGKTSWILAMVRAVLCGHPFMGEPTEPTSVVYLTEERSSTFRAALERAGLLDRHDLYVLEWRDTLGVAWASVVQQAVNQCEEVQAKLLVVDTVSQFATLAGDSENNSGDVLAAYEALQKAAAAGLAVISIRHERKTGGDVSTAGRGSSAFAGAADIILAVRRPEGNTRPTIREIHALSRFDETPDRTSVDRVSDGNYVAMGDSSAVATAEAREALLRVLPTSEAKALEFKPLMEKAGIKRTTGQVALEQLIADGLVVRIGKGVKRDPHRFYAKPIPSAATPSVGEAESVSAHEEEQP